MSKVEMQTGKLSNRERQNGKCEHCDATSHSCKVTWAIRYVHVQPESVRTQPAVVNLLRPVEFETILQRRIFDAWHQWCNTGRVVVTRNFWAFFCRLFDRVPVRILTSDFHHQSLQKRILQDQRLWFWSAVCLQSSSRTGGGWPGYDNNSIWKERYRQWPRSAMQWKNPWRSPASNLRHQIA